MSKNPKLPGPASAGLIGSTTLPSILTAPDGSAIPLGDVVRHANQETGLSAEDWNALPQAERDAHIEKSAVALGVSTAPAAPDKDEPEGVLMVRTAAQTPGGPTEALVHPDEVAEWERHDWRKA